MLVVQQAAAVREWCASVQDRRGAPAEVAEYHGELALPRPSFRVLVSTPKAFQVAQHENPDLLGWDVFSHITFDEVHHVLKEHPYRKIALQLQGQRGAVVRVLGLTASLSYAVDRAGIDRAVRQLTKELRIEHVAAAGQAELAAAGYHGNHAVAEVYGAEQAAEAAGSPSGASSDVVDVLTSQSPTAAWWGSHGPVPEAERKPHLLAVTFWKRVDTGQCTDFAAALVAAVHRAESCIKDAGFASPIARGAKTRGKMSAWGEYAAKRGKESAASRAELWALEQWYESLRILAVSWEENVEGAVMFLKMMFTGPVAAGSAAALYQRESQPGATPAVAQLKLVAKEFLDRHDTADIYNHFERLKRALLSKLELHGSGFRGILFVQQRVTVHILAHFLRHDKDTCDKFRCAELYASSSPATPSLAIGKREAAAAVEAFGRGAANLLVSTVVAEEGMDVPAANCVFRFDPVLNAVSYVQGRGRARQTDSSFVVLRERADRPAERLHEVEALQLEVAARFVAGRGDAASEASARQADEEAQCSRERGAAATLEKHVAAGAAAATLAVAALNLYVKKTKAALEESLGMCSGGAFECTLTYRSCLREVAGKGAGADKKEAKRAAAHDLLHALHGGTGPQP